MERFLLLGLCWWSMGDTGLIPGQRLRSIMLLLLLLLSHFSRVRLCSTPSLGFSRLRMAKNREGEKKRFVLFCIKLLGTDLKAI